MQFHKNQLAALGVTPTNVQANLLVKGSIFNVGLNSKGNLNLRSRRMRPNDPSLLEVLSFPVRGILTCLVKRCN